MAGSIKLDRSLIETAVRGSKQPDDARKLWLSIEKHLQDLQAAASTQAPAAVPSPSSPSSSQSGSNSQAPSTVVVQQVSFSGIQQLAQDPISPTPGQVWYNTSTNQIKLWDGTAIQIVAELANTLDQFQAPAVDLSVGGHKLTNLSDPGTAQDAATKNYVDARPAVFSGTGAPASGIGNNGDYYLNTSNGLMYQKSAGAWASLALSTVGKGAIKAGLNVTVTDNGDGTTTVASTGGGGLPSKSLLVQGMTPYSSASTSWNNYTIRWRLGAHQVLAPNGNFKIRFAFNGGTGITIGNVVIKRTNRGSTAVIDTTAVTFNTGAAYPYAYAFGFTASPTKPAFLDSDTINLAIDDAHDFWVYLYTPTDSSGANYNATVGYSVDSTNPGQSNPIQGSYTGGDQTAETTVGTGTNATQCAVTRVFIP
jgi:hypothetical protein